MNMSVKNNMLHLCHTVLSKSQPILSDPPPSKKKDHRYDRAIKIKDCCL